MKRLFSFLFVMVLLLGVSVSANSALIDRGGGLIYDTDLDVTWFQDMKYAMTTGYDSDGRLTWNEAVSWVDGLEYYDSVRGITWTDWRLPKALPVNPPNYNYESAHDGSADKGYNITSPNTEIPYMYYVNLGNIGYEDENGNKQEGYGWQNVGLFTNFNNPIPLWTGTECPDYPDYAFSFMRSKTEDHGFTRG